MKRLRKNKPNAMALTATDGSPISNPRDVAASFQKCYSAIFSEMGQQVQMTLPESSFDQELMTVVFSTDDICQQLQCINTYSAMGPDQIHPRILKETAFELTGTYCQLFNQTIQIGTLPQIWKEAAVVPIYKNGDCHVPSNYRPVSLTSIPCKSLGKLLKQKNGASNLEQSYTRFP